MAISDEVQQERDGLFSGVGAGASLRATDPEFAAVFEDFAFDETLRSSSLATPDRLTYQLGAVIAVGALSPFRALLDAALTAGVPPVVVKEVVYQSVAYVGFARARSFLDATNEELTARGVPLPLEGQSTTDPTTRADVGIEQQKAIVGSATVDAMYVNAPDDAVHFQRFLSANCFGDYYTRGGLDVRQRELLTFAMLVGLGGADNQVKGHVAANLNVGNSRAELLSVLTVLVPYIGYPRTLNGLAAVNDGAPA